MKSFIITKWVEPYKLLETVKKYCNCKDYTFDGLNKQVQKDKFLNDLSLNSTIGLYMKNVNKFYLFNFKEDVDIIKILTDTFQFVSGDFEYTDDIEQSFNKVDLGKAEASLIIK